MAAERWVRPPVVAREAPPAWVALWRFRLVAALVLGLLVLAAVLAFRQVTGANAQDPGIDALGSGVLGVLLQRYA